MKKSQSLAFSAGLLLCIACVFSTVVFRLPYNESCSAGEFLLCWNAAVVRPRHLQIAVEDVRLRNSPIALFVCRRPSRYGGSMEREYDLFEQFPNGDVLWRMTVIGHENAIQQLRELAATTYNEVRAVHLPTQAVVAVMNRPTKESPSPSRPIRLGFE